MRTYIWLAAALLLGGCAAKLPQTEQLDGKKLRQAETRLNAFLAQSCVEAVDSDVQIGWRAYGQEETYSAELQAAAPSSLRLALTDPLGRPLLLLASDGRVFTLADNRKSAAWTGSTDLKFVRRFIPEFIPASDLFSWLSGRVSKEKMRAAAARTDAAGTVWWHGGVAGDVAHIIAMDKENRLSRHLAVDRKTNEMLFEARYSGYLKTGKDCAWPGRIDLSGKVLEADYTLSFTGGTSFDPVSPARFQLRLPPHFTVKEMTGP
jgi:outer membrane biogenesis lipoprotein LolB